MRMNFSWRVGVKTASCELPSVMAKEYWKEAFLRDRMSVRMPKTCRYTGFQENRTDEEWLYLIA